MFFYKLIFSAVNFFVNNDITVNNFNPTLLSRDQNNYHLLCCNQWLKDVQSFANNLLGSDEISTVHVDVNHICEDNW